MYPIHVFGFEILISRNEMNSYQMMYRNMIRKLKFQYIVEHKQAPTVADRRFAKVGKQVAPSFPINYRQSL